MVPGMSDPECEQGDRPAIGCSTWGLASELGELRPTIARDFQEAGFWTI